MFCSSKESWVWRVDTLLPRPCRGRAPGRAHGQQRGAGLTGTVGSGRRGPALEERFGRAVRDRRQEIGMTQAGLAALAGMSQAAISRLERGRCLPTLHLLERVAVALDSVLLVAIEPGRVVVDFRARPGSRVDGIRSVAATDG
ncbi:helix-turn-helix domain-containing protein [Streptomyces sp. NPDC087428]|uniref:helix-turn-helix domain-containing protein n=1 Tax=Streptomyces sp. NPDC087428 TaxID=3365788 RepID=UPI003800CCCF